MTTFGDFLQAQLGHRPPAHFGIVSADALRNKYDRLLSAINALGLSIEIAHKVERTVGLPDYTNWLRFQVAWNQFYAANRPWSVLWSSDDDWKALEIWSMDYQTWRTFYEEAAQRQAPPHAQPEEVPEPPSSKWTIPSVTSAGPPFLDTTPLGIGLGIAGLALLAIWASGQKGR